ncbi:MAG: Stp1/IreP family PP2C-type Ser/Thr phosphatase [Acidobacteria bacterium]|nr:Stp1/IreP family PP2C-type Ser/Thr phosphatase [Acidobacteriota bacterium]
MENCPLCGFKENQLSSLNCSNCGESLEPTLTKTKNFSGALLLPKDRFITEGLFLEKGNLKYYSVYEVLDPSKTYTIITCPKNSHDALANAIPDLNSNLLTNNLTGNLPSNNDESIKENSPFYSLFYLLARFNSPSVLRASSYFSDDELAYLIVERLEGQLLSKVGKLSEAEVRQIGIQLCQIVDNFHRQRFVHNALNPNSLVMDAQGLVKVISFNQVRPIKYYNPNHPIELTKGFSAPELYNLTERSILDKRSDIYSIGAMLYWLLTAEVLSTNEVYSPRSQNWQLYPQAVVSPSFERIILRAIASDPNDRYNSVNEIKFALAALSTPTAIQVSYASDIGKHREINEDSVLLLDLRQCFESVNNYVGLYVVSDGMGGEAAGEVASRITVRAIGEWVTERLTLASLRSMHGTQLVQASQTGSLALLNDGGTNIRVPQLITSAILHANSEVLDYAHYHPSTRGLGATVTVALLAGNILTVGQVGDSRCYIISNDRLEQLTEDHSLVERMVRRGELTKEEARVHPHRNIIYRSIGSRDDLEVDIVTRMVRRGDVILLCSDGLNAMLSDIEIANIVKRNSNPWQITKELVVAANANGGEDNISVIVIKID